MCEAKFSIEIGNGNPRLKALIDQAEDFFPSEGKGLKESGNARQ
nr:MAG TPA_asm: hypothetical protein [Caudoviricetes sp.]